MQHTWYYACVWIAAMTVAFVSVIAAARTRSDTDVRAHALRCSSAATVVWTGIPLVVLLVTLAWSSWRLTL